MCNQWNHSMLSEHDMKEMDIFNCLFFVVWRLCSRSNRIHGLSKIQRNSGSKTHQNLRQPLAFNRCDCGPVIFIFLYRFDGSAINKKPFRMIIHAKFFSFCFVLFVFLSPLNPIESKRAKHNKIMHFHNAILSCVVYLYLCFHSYSFLTFLCLSQYVYVIVVCSRALLLLLNFTYELINAIISFAST